MPPEGATPREVIFEFITLGQSVKVTAVDVATGTEVSVVGAVLTPQKELQRIALLKLKQRLEREGEKSPVTKPRDDGPSSGGGILA